MAKRFLTARDIDEHANMGVFEIQIGNDLVITDVGKERARERGVKLILLQPGETTPPHPVCSASTAEEVHEQVRSAVIARLGSAPADIDRIIQKVMQNLK